MPRQPDTTETRSSIKRASDAISRQKRAVFERFPLAFTLLVTAGLVATLYGFERLFDQIDLFANNPVIMIITGISILVGTGTLYKQLGKE